MNKLIKRILRTGVTAAVIWLAFWFVMQKAPVTDSWLGGLFLLVIALLLGDWLAKRMVGQ